MNKALRMNSVVGNESVHLPRFNNKNVTVKQETDDDGTGSPRRSKPQRQTAPKWNTFPSPASGISEECLAMANACNHDHDYVVLPLSKSKEFERDGGNDTPCVSSESMPTIKSEFPTGKNNLVPKPPLILYANNSDQDKIIRRQSLRRGAKVNARITKLFFTSDSKTTYRPSRPKSSTNNFKNAQVHALKDTRVESTKAEALSKNISNNNNNHKSNKDDMFESDEDIHNIPNHSTPISNSSILSPRMSITPMPPTVQRSSSRGFRGPSRRHIQRQYVENYEGDVTDCELNVSNDSAYSSLSCSANSHPRTPSAGRPQSGDKRSATSNLSSSSSFSSTDEDSDIDLKDEPQKNEIEKLHRFSTEKDQHIPKIITKKGHKKVKEQEDVCGGEKISTDRQKFIPAPPSQKPRKGNRLHDPLPMRLRALPTSFWQEPNKVNAVPYSVLPPVFKQTDMDDMEDIRPITPPNEDSPKKILPIRTNNTTIGAPKKVVIKTGDTDLLLRLFDKIETKRKPSQGTRAKRGRPRRTPRCAIPPPRIPQNEDPCIIDSITEKLFPKLSLEHRNIKPQKAKFNEGKEHCDAGSEDYDSVAPPFGSKLFTEYNDFNADYSIEDTFKDLNEGMIETIIPPNITAQRSVSVSLPQLTNTGPDLSHILSELAAGL